MSDLPQGSIIYNMPLEVRYLNYIIAGGILLVIAIVYIILHLIYLSLIHILFALLQQCIEVSGYHSAALVGD